MITSRSRGLRATHTTSLFGVAHPRPGARPRINCSELAGNPLSLRNFARIRREKGLTQEAVEERSCFSQQYLSGLERGRRNPTIVTLYELAQALNVSYLDRLKPDSDD
jgi:DNA-binding XRE family transcriptional regulator